MFSCCLDPFHPATEFISEVCLIAADMHIALPRRATVLHSLQAFLICGGNASLWVSAASLDFITERSSEMNDDSVPIAEDNKQPLSLPCTLSILIK